MSLTTVLTTDIHSSSHLLSDFAKIFSPSSSDCGISFFPKDCRFVDLSVEERFLQLQASMIPIQPWSSNSNSPRDVYWNNRMVEVVAFTHSCLWRTRTVHVLRETSPRCVSLGISKRAILPIFTYISKSKKKIFHKVRLPYKLRKEGFLVLEGERREDFFSGSREIHIERGATLTHQRQIFFRTQVSF